MTRPTKSVVGAVRADCARCGTPCWRQLVGQRAALNVLADVAPYVAGTYGHPTPTDSLWCVAVMHGGGVDLRWRCPRTAPCGREHVICHVCPPGTPKARRPEGALW